MTTVYAVYVPDCDKLDCHGSWVHRIFATQEAAEECTSHEFNAFIEEYELEDA